MGRETGYPGGLAGIPQGNPSQRRGGAPSGAGGVVTGPSRWTLGANARAWTPGVLGNPGTLGESPIQFVGVYDRRPWEGIPGKRNLQWYRERIQAVMGESLMLRIVAEPAAAQFPVPLYGLRGTMKDSALSVIVAGWEVADLTSLPPPTSRTNDPTDPVNSTWFAARLAVMGPNVMGDLITSGRSEVDVGCWAGNSRFVAVWLWNYWANIAQIDTLDIQYSVLDRPRFEYCPWQPITVTYPAPIVATGAAISPPTDDMAIFRSGSFPTRGGSTIHRYALVNGSGTPLSVYVRHLIGPHADLSNFTGREDVIGLSVGETFVDTSSSLDLVGHSHLGFWAETTLGGGTAGPMLISVAGSG